LLGALPLIPLGALLERRVRPLLLVSLFYVATYSFLPHKARTRGCHRPTPPAPHPPPAQEVRFLFPVLPLLNAVAACGLSRAFERRRKSPTWRLLCLASLGLLLLTLAAKLAMALAAAWNYPGGWALLRLHARACPGGPGLVHVGVLPAMTGVSRFGEARGWAYSKAEGLSDAQLAQRNVSQLLSARQSVQGYARVGAVQGFTRLRLQRAFPLLRADRSDQVFIHCRE